MRKLFFVLIIIALIFSSCASWAEDTSLFPSEALEALDSFGVHMTYKTNSSVVLRSGKTPYYANVTSYEAQKVSLAGKRKKGDYDYYSELPHGTLTVISGDNSPSSSLTPSLSGTHYPLSPTYGIGIVDYICGNWYEEFDQLAGQRVMWNIYTSPDITVGSMTVPVVSEVSIPVNGIVPCLELIRDDENNQEFIHRARLYFTELGKTEAVDVNDVSRIRYTLTNKNGDTLRNEVYSDFDSEMMFGVEVPEDDFGNITIEYDKGLTTYIWTFEFMGIESTYELGVLDEERPLKLQLDETKEITIKLPSTLELEVDENNNLNVGISSVNSDVLGVFDTSYEIGGFSWNDDLTSNDKKTSITFYLHGDNEGRTALKIDTPDRNFLFEVWVTDEDGNLPEQGELPNLKAEVNVHESHARHIAGKPFYPSAEFSNLELIVTGDTDAMTTGTNEETGEVYPSSGVFGLTNDDESILLYMYVDYNEANSSEGANKFYVGGNDIITTEDLSGYNVWWDIQYRPEFNVISTPMSTVYDDKNFKTTEEQMKNFVPYFELHHPEDDIWAVDYLKWSFINPSTGEKVEPEISDLTILAFNNSPTAYEGTSGTIEFEDLPEWGGRIIFEYTYQDVRYRWVFDGMEHSHSYAELPFMGFSEGSSMDFTIQAYDPDTVESFYIFPSSTDVFTVDPVSSDNVQNFTFTATGLKSTEGNEEHLFLVTKRKGFSEFNSYVYKNNDVYVYVESEPEDSEPEPGFNDTFVSGDLEVSIRYKPKVSIIEGKTYYYGDMPKAPVVELVRDDFLEYGVYEEYKDALTGTLHFYNGNNEISSVSLAPVINEMEYKWERNKEYVKVGYGEHNCPEGTTKISWEFTNNSNNSGSENIPSAKTPNFKPYVKLNREGINVKSLECYFVDENNNKIAYPSGISNAYLRVETYGIGGFTTESLDVPVTINGPDMYMRNVLVQFKYEGLVYRWIFYPVDNASSYWESNVSSDIFTWNTESPDYPLVMRVGDIKTVTLRTNNIPSPEAVIGDSSIVSMETLSSSNNALVLRLTAKSAGMTSLSVRLTTNELSTWPREIWVADTNGKVPHLTNNIDELFNELISGDTNIRGGGGGGDRTPDHEPDPKPGPDESIVDVGIPGLSVYPRFAMPQYPSDEAFKSMLEYMSTLELGELEDFIYSENISIIESPDAFEMFKSLSADLISQDTPQLLAVVLPVFEVKTGGYYMFRIPIDNVKNPGTTIFFNSRKENETANVSAVPMTDDEAKEALNDDKMLFITDKGEPADIMSGDEYINVAVYLAEGTYSPVVTAEATTNDVALILTAISPDVPVPPVNPDESPDVPVPPVNPDESPDVPVPPVNPDESPDVPVPPVNPDESPDVPVTPVSPDESPDVPVPPVNPEESPDVDSHKGGGGESSTEIEPEPAKPEAPRVKVEEVAEKVVGIIRSISGSLSRLIDSDIKVAELPEDAVGSERSIDDVSDEDLASIPANQTPAYVLPIIAVSESGIYVFGLSLDNLNAGAPIYLMLMGESSSASSGMVSGAADDSDSENAYTFLDDEGNEVNTVPNNKHVNAAAYMEAGKTYAPIITTEATSASTTTSRKGGSGGCDSGFSVYALVLAGLSLALRRRK